VDAYRRETKSLVTRFLHNKLSFESCIYSLDAALLRLIARMKAKQLNELRSVMLANNDRVMEEMARRGRLELPRPKAKPKRKPRSKVQTK